MALKNNMSNEEIMKVCKTRPEYEETYKKGVVLPNHDELIERIKRPGSFVEILKHADIGGGVDAITVKVYCNRD